MWTNDDVKDYKLDLQKGPITSIWITATRDLRLPLPFASFAQEAIPLNQQYKELLEERQKRLYQERLRQQKKAQERQEQEQRQEQRREQRFIKELERKLLKERQQLLLKYRPQPSDYRHCQEHFDSKNKLFQHLEHCKPRSRASSVNSQSSARSRASSRASSTSSVSSRVSRASSASSTSSIATTASIEKVQLQILSQLHAVQKIKPLAHVRRCRNPVFQPSTPP